MVSVNDAAQYLKQYVESYRHEYRRFIAAPPNGGGFPDLQISPYLYSTQIFCFLANDGAVVMDFSRQPSYQWEIAGGPALVVDTPERRRPSKEVKERIAALRTAAGIPPDGDVSLYPIVAQDGLPDDVWRGRLPEPKDAAEEHAEGTRITVNRYDVKWTSLIERLTYGAFCNILDVRLPSQDSPFWNPHIIRDFGFMTADMQKKTFYHYLELLPHVERAAWDCRNLRARVFIDIHRDFIAAINSSEDVGGTIFFGGPEAPLAQFRDRLSALEDAIKQLEVLLLTRNNEDEAVFHEFLKANPILLDVYGELISKPRFRYPEGESPLGKAYVEPDFIIRYPGDKYKLVELEKPGKRLATSKGQTRAEVSQATFQIAEWMDYIRNHYELIKLKFPGISVNCSSMVVIGRASEESIGAGRNTKRYMQMAGQQFAADELLSYDDLVDKAKQAYVRLQSLTISSQ